jgi:hypothetical protein
MENGEWIMEKGEGLPDKITNVVLACRDEIFQYFKRERTLVPEGQHGNNGEYGNT